MGVMGRTAREHGEHYVASKESSTGSTAGEHREHGVMRNMQEYSELCRGALGGA